MRRSFLRSVVTSSLLAAALPARSQAAAPPVGQLWPACSTPGQWYCIASATHDGLATPIGDGASDFSDAGIQLVAALQQDNNGNVYLDWETEGGLYQSLMDPAFSGAHLQFVLNAGDFRPSLTTATANQLHVGMEGDADAGYVVTVDGTPADTNYDAAAGFVCNADGCGDDTSMATVEQWYFSGTIYQPFVDDAGTTHFGDFHGSFLASNAQYIEGPQLLEGGLIQLHVANPHLEVDGGAASGAYTYWIDPDYLSHIHMTPEEAVDGGLSVDRVDGTDGGTGTPLAAQFTVDDAGVFGTGVMMRLDPLTYSAPTLKLHPRSSVADAGTGLTGSSGGGCTAPGTALPLGTLALAALGLALRGRKRSRQG